MKLAFFFILRIIFFPIMLVLNLMIFVRNWLYYKKILKSVTPEVFCINVGNLNLGGTGKTPHVEYLVRLLADKYKTTILSRGYLRKTKGFVLADENSTAQSIGDEPMQYYLKFKDKINVVVCEDRVKGVKEIEKNTPPQPSPKGRELRNSPLPFGEGSGVGSSETSVGLVILDDAFQHRKIKPHLNLLLCDYTRPFYKDNLVPFGSLRDLRTSAKRADAVIVSKCPKDISFQEYKNIKAGIMAYTKSVTPIFFSRIKYKIVAGYAPKSIFKLNQATNIVTGIAKPEVFVEYLFEQRYNINDVKNFPDHYAFSRKDIDEIIIDTAQFKQISQIITTEKDMVKLKPLLSEEEIKHFFYLPIEIKMEDKKGFDAFILSKVKEI